MLYIEWVAPTVPLFRAHHYNCLSCCEGIAEFVPDIRVIGRYVGEADRSVSNAFLDRFDRNRDSRVLIYAVGFSVGLLNRGVERVRIPLIELPIVEGLIDETSGHDSGLTARHNVAHQPRRFLASAGWVGYVLFALFGNRSGCSMISCVRSTSISGQ